MGHGAWGMGKKACAGHGEEGLRRAWEWGIGNWVGFF